MLGWKAWLAWCFGVLVLLAPAAAARAETYFGSLPPPPAETADGERERDCLALNIYWEARSESHLGKLAVAAVTLNRVAAPEFPDSVCAVVNQGEERGRHLCQFSWRCDGLADQPGNVAAWLDARKVAQQALERRLVDPTDGALWYHADHVQPAWARDMAMHARIGHHLFYGDRGRASLIASRDGAAGLRCAPSMRCASRERQSRLVPKPALRPQLADAWPLAPTPPAVAPAAGAMRSLAGTTGTIGLAPLERQPLTAQR